jgi:hypothetical protein
MHYIQRGMAAGFAGAAAVAAILLLTAELGILSQIDFIARISVATGIGFPAVWTFHFAVGALLGALFAWLDPDLPGDSLRQRGVILSSIAWALMMLFIMPLTGAGVFGLYISVLVPLGTLVLHVIFGAVMGSAYGWLILQAVPLRYRHTSGRYR